jgi:hypothetical protein
LPVAADATAIVAYLLGDRALFSAIVFGLCNAGEAVLTRAHRAFLRFGFQVFPRLDGTGPDHLAALVRIRRTRHRRGCTAVDRARLSGTRAAVAKRGHRRRYGVRGAGRSERPCCFRTASVNRRQNLTPDRRPLYVSIEFATAAHSCACGCGREVVTPPGPTDWRITSALSQAQSRSGIIRRAAPAWPFSRHNDERTRIHE